MEEKDFIINEIIIGSFAYDEYHEKLLLYTTEGMIEAEISMSQQQYDELQKENPDFTSLWNALANLFGDEELEISTCPVCGKRPSINYACGEYFIDSGDGCSFCGSDGSFTEMRSMLNDEVRAWNAAVHDKTKIS